MNKFECSECGTKYSSSETTPPPGIKWSDGHVCTPKHISLIEKMKPLQEQWQKDMDKSLQEPKQDRTCNNNCSDVCGECQIFEPKQETTSEGFHRISKEIDYSEFDFVSFKIGIEWRQEQDKKCFHPLPYRLSKSDVNYECTLCGKFI
jgi:hypothetical protein